MRTLLPKVAGVKHSVEHRQPSNLNLRDRPVLPLNSPASWTPRSVRRLSVYEEREKSPLGSVTERSSANRPSENARQDRQIKPGFNRRKVPEKLVGLSVTPKIGLEVEYSQEAIKHYNRTQTLLPGLITSIDHDGLMCIVSWDDGTSDYSCIGYKGKYFLVMRENNLVDGREREYNLRQALDATHSPKFQLDPETSLWRLKSKVKDERSFVKKLREGKEFLRCVVLPEVRKEIKQQKQEEEIAIQRSIEDSIKTKAKLANYAKNEQEDVRRLKHLLGANPRQKQLIREEVLKEPLSAALARHHEQALGLGSNFVAFVSPTMSFRGTEGGLPLWLLRSPLTKLPSNNE